MMLLHLKHEQSEEIEEILSETDFDVLSYDRQWKQYRFRLTDKDIENNKETLLKLVKLAFDSYMA